MLVNLLNNAAKYTRSGGSIALTATREEDEAVIRIRDDGIGIPADLLPKVFDLFTQSERSLDRSQGGLGIGLTLVKSLIELHGGRVSAHSEGLDAGSEFEIRLPALEGSGEPAAVVPERPEGECRGRRILVVDDSDDMTQSLRILLEHAGHEARVVHDGPAALVAYRTYQPDVVLLDVGLPGMNGYDIARQLRREQGDRAPLLVAVSGYGQEEDKRLAREAGFEFHLTKPVDPARLIELVSSVVKRA